MYIWIQEWMNEKMNEYIEHIECNEWFMYECHYSMSDSFEDVSDVSSDGT